MMSATEYSIGVVKNRFALNGIEEEEIDPVELLKRRELETEAKKKSKICEKVTKIKDSSDTKTKDSSKNKANKITKESNKIEVVTQKDKSVLKSKQKDNEVTKKHVTIVEKNNKHYPDNASDYQEHDDDFGEKERKDYQGGGLAFEGESLERGRGPRRGLPRGVFVRGGGARGGWRSSQRAMFDTRGKREYDRQSGSDKTGIKSVDKRDGSGAHNWGNPRDDIETLKTPYSAEDGWNTEKVEGWNSEKVEGWNSEKVDEELPVECNDTNNEEEIETNTADADNTELENEEKKELTLDEWKALKTPRKQPTYNIRKAGEGEDLSQWKNMYALEKKKDNEGEEFDYEYELSEYPQRVGRQKIIEIDIRYKDTRNVGTGRGRGVGRGSAAAVHSGRGSYSPFQNTTANNNRTMIDIPKVYDERDFPSLA